MIPLRQPARREGAPRSATNGYAQIPNSIIENLSLFTPAELYLTLILHRRNNSGATVPDENVWTKWTGLDPKMKRLAILGMAAKGIEVIEGRGDEVRLRWDWSRWDHYVRTTPRHEKARTHGRKKTAAAKPGQRIHPECRERGCQKLCGSEDQEKCEVISIESVSDRKPVSDFADTSPPPDTGPPASDSGSSASQAAFPEGSAAPSGNSTLAVQKHRGSEALAQVSPYPQQFLQFMGTFMQLGIEAGPKDFERTFAMWSRLKPKEQAAATAEAQRKYSEWSARAVRYVPRPWNFLKERQWERRTMAQGRERDAGRSERAQIEAERIFDEEDPDIKF